MDYTKNSVKLLPVIENFENKVVLYSEFDGNYVVGDKLYIMIIDSGSTDYKLDSFQSSGNTYSSIGYELLKKDGNKLTLDINYTSLALTGLTSNNCFIGKIYIKNGTISKGIINGILLFNVIISPISILGLLWYQGIIRTSPNDINYIDFNSNTEGDLILKSEVLSNGLINSFYTINNYNNGLSIINLLDTNINLSKCNINSGTFNNCELYGTNHTITNGILNNCYIGPSCIITGGNFINSELADITVTWKNGTWDNSWTGTTGNPFNVIIWSGGTWKNGIFPSSSVWLTGRFMKGVFNGVGWYGGTFGINDGSIDNPVFSGRTWYDGTFNGGLMSESTWLTGIFNNGIFNNGSTWTTGTFNNGTFSLSTWLNGIFNNGTFSESTWTNGIFNNGIFNNGSTWTTGTFNNGTFSESIWQNGYFYDGKFQDSTWENGSFYKGSMFKSNWKDGDLFFGVMNSVKWYSGTWHNGIANDLKFYDGTWLNGVWNYGTFYKGTWYNGSFNSGYFSGNTDSTWLNGNFYFGEFGGTWSGGTFYTGEIKTSIPSSNIIGREFKQYNKTGLISNKFNTVKLPAKKRY